MITFNNALEIVFQNIPELQTTVTGLNMCGSSYLAEDVRSSTDLPPFDNSSMDGYALRADDTVKATPHHAVGLNIVGVVQAGDRFQGSIAAGETTVIATGAPVPEGADAIIPLEFTARKTPQKVLVFRSVKKHENIRFAGEEIKKGELILRQHDLINAGRLALLASIGHLEIIVYKKPVVGFLATGNELVAPEVMPGEAQIRNSNTLMIRYLTESEGFRFIDYGIAPDTEESIREAIAKFDLPDILITSAGVSVGEFDLVIKALEPLGLKTHFWKAAIKPGKPLLFGSLGKALYFGLPGNPVSGAVMFFQFIAPVLRSMSGDLKPFKTLSKAIAAENFAKSTGRIHFARGISYFDEDWYVRSAGRQGSHMLSSLTDANCFILIPADHEITKGDTVFIQNFEGPTTDLNSFRQAIAELLK